jgi:hypothetical protein
MVLLEIDSVCFSRLPLESDAPRTIDVKAVSFRCPVQWMEVETRKIQLLKGLSQIEGVESPQASLVKAGVDPPCGPGQEELLESFVVEALDHLLGVTWLATGVK